MAAAGMGADVEAISGAGSGKETRLVSMAGGGGVGRRAAGACGKATQRQSGGNNTPERREGISVCSGNSRSGWVATSVRSMKRVDAKNGTVDAVTGRVSAQRPETRI